MILNLLKFLPKDNSPLMDAVNKLMVMSDSEYIELAYILRKIMRECDYDTERCVIMFRGFDIMQSTDYDIFVTLSKLISKSPFEDSNDAKAKVEEVIK